MQNEYNKALRAIPMAPGRLRPPFRAGFDPNDVAPAINAISEKLRSARETPEPRFSFREVEIELEPFSLTVVGVETLMNALSGFHYNVTFGGTCSPTAAGIMRVSWQD